MREGRLKHFGWGREGEGLTPEEEGFVLDRARARFGVQDFEQVEPPALADLALAPPRLVPPAVPRAHLLERALRPRRAYLRQGL